MAYPSGNAGRLAEYVGLPAVTPFVTSCAMEAAEMVGAWLVGQGFDFTAYPYDYNTTVDRAVLEVGAELFHRKNTKNAVAQFASPDGSPVRIARDPMVAAYPILRQLVGGGFA